MFYEPAFGNRERMTSTFIDPISLGHFLASCGIYIFYFENKSKMEITALVLSIIGMGLALSKGAILQFIIGVLILNPRIPLLFKLVAAGLGALSILALPQKEGILLHIKGFTNSINSLELFGHGIGAAGNYTAMFSSNPLASSELNINDTFIGSMLGQIGLVGTIAWIIIITLIVALHAKTKKGLNGALRIFYSIFAISILSENTMNITSFLLPAAIIGLALRIDYRANVQKNRTTQLFSIKKKSKKVVEFQNYGSHIKA